MKHKLNDMKLKIQKHHNGFTLIEMSLVLLIMGIVMLPLVQLYASYVESEKTRVTKENVRKIVSLMAINDVRFSPCPADRSVGLNNPNYGMSVGCSTAAEIAAIPVCNGTAQGICRTPGTRDTAADADAVADWVFIGGVPIKDQVGNPIGSMTGTLMYDGWHNKINYAVSQGVADQTNDTGVDNFKFGVINGIDENGNQTAGIGNNPTNDGDAMYVVWSSGPNGGGAYTLGGAMPVGCPVGNNDTANCDNNNTFRQGIGVSEGATAAFFDDYSYFYLQNAGELWANSRTPAGQLPHIYNLNTRNIGIKMTPAPLGAFLQVNGNVEAPTLRTNNVTSVIGASTLTGQIPPVALAAQPPDNLAGLCIAIQEVIRAYAFDRPTGGVLTLGGGCGGRAETTIAATAVGALKTLNCHTTYGNTFWIRGVTTDRCVICSDGTTDQRLC